MMIKTLLVAGTVALLTACSSMSGFMGGGSGTGARSSNSTMGASGGLTYPDAMPPGGPNGNSGGGPN